MQLQLFLMYCKTVRMKVTILCNANENILEWNGMNE